MTLVIDNRLDLGDNPGVHALIVGVSDMPHTAGGWGSRAEETFGIQSVEGAAISAYRFYDWLIEQSQHLPRPLATVRLLLSPMDGTAFPVQAPIESASLDNFLAALYDWRADATTHQDHVTFFYFAGWGFGVSNDIALVLSDFGRPSRPLMWSTVSFDNIYWGMSPSFIDKDVATTQFYFVDAGRAYFREAMPYLSSVTAAFNLAPKVQRDVRNAPVFYSSVAGGLPFSRIGGTTLFGESLLNCLKGQAAEAADEYVGGERRWRVSVNSLNAALEREFDKLRKELGESFPQNYALGGTVKDATICYLPAAPPMKALVVDRRKERGDNPGLHVVIAGVSSYSHGKGGRGTPARIDLGIEQLSSAATSAYLLCRWLLDHQDRLSVPLATLRVLLSPVADEIVRTPALADFGDRCTLQNFLRAAGEWRDDAAKHSGSSTLFYFAGHGAQRTKGDSVLLFEDFGDGVGGPLRNAVDMENVFFGMAPSRDRKRIARTQLYFVDACRVRPAVFRNYQFMHTTAVFDIDELERDDRKAPIFFAATSGSLAYAVPGQQTTFSRVLLDCLNADAVHTDPSVGDGRTLISIHSLDRGLQAGIEVSNKKTGADQEYALEGIAKDAVVFAWDN